MVKPTTRLGNGRSDGGRRGAGVARRGGAAGRVGRHGRADRRAVGSVGRHAGAALGARPGRVLRDVAVMLADGGDCVTDMDAYRGQERLFGARASETTTHRVLKSIDEALLGPGPRSARRGAGAGVGRGRSAGDDHVEHRRDAC